MLEKDVNAPHGYRKLHCTSCGYVETVPIRCTSKLCHPCRFARLFRIHQRLVLTLGKFKHSQGYAWKHVTLTVPDTADLSAGINHLVQSFRRLRSTRWWSAYALGGFYVIEVKKSSDLWHPHLHIIVYARFLPWGVLLTRWMRSSRTGRHIWVTAIWNNVSIASYISRYLTKIPHLSPDDAYTYDHDTHGLRMYNSFGTLHEVFKVERLPRYIRPCPKCNNVHWLPDFLLDLLERRAIVDARPVRRL